MSFLSTRICLFLLFRGAVVGQKYRSLDSNRLAEDFIRNILNILNIDDDKIKLGVGGCLPLPDGHLNNDKQFYIVIGLPASGKSSISAKIADATGSAVLDSDFAKRKLPEFREKDNGASLVHKESQVIVMGNPENQ